MTPDALARLYRLISKILTATFYVGIAAAIVLIVAYFWRW